MPPPAPFLRTGKKKEKNDFGGRYSQFSDWTVSFKINIKVYTLLR
jgi:hypothetical protein